MKAQRLSSDRISTLPPVIIETILSLVPIKEAARTSILSRDWRYNWNKIPKLEFNEKEMFADSTAENQLSDNLEHTFGIQSQSKEMTQRCKLFYALYQILLLHQGPILDFNLSMDADHSCFEIDHIILGLSRMNTVKKLHLSCFCLLPSSIFSFHQLTELYLYNCGIPHPPTFKAFGSLKILCLEYVDISKEALMHILNNSPALRSFKMLTGYDNPVIYDGSNIVELFKCLSLIEDFTLSFYGYEGFAQGVFPRKLPTSLVHLRCFSLEGVCFHDGSLDTFVLLIRSSPNMEKLKIQIHCEDHISHFYWERDIDSFTLQDYSDIWLENLFEFEIGGYIDTLKPELEFVKLILAKSPVLKKVSIMHSNELTKDDELKMFGYLLSSPPKSPLVEISFEYHT